MKGFTPESGSHRGSSSSSRSTDERNRKKATSREYVTQNIALHATIKGVGREVLDSSVEVTLDHIDGMIEELGGLATGPSPDVDATPEPESVPDPVAA